MDKLVSRAIGAFYFPPPKNRGAFKYPDGGRTLPDGRIRSSCGISCSSLTGGEILNVGAVENRFASALFTKSEQRKSRY